MRKVQLFIGCVVSCLITAATVNALTETPVIVIEAVQTGDAISPKHEFIQLRNTSNVDIDMTNWSLVYSGDEIYTFKTQASKHVMLPAHASETIFSAEYVLDPVSSPSYAEVFSLAKDKGLNAAMGTVVVRDANKSIVDQISWGSTENSQTKTKLKTNETTVLRHKPADETGQYFELVDQSTYHPLYGSLVDVADVCSNIEGFQAELPDNMELSEGRCISPFVPADLELSEVLPNPNGTDSGHEFVEIYNNSDVPVDMITYYLVVGDKVYDFPTDSTVPAHSYRVWTDDAFGMTLPNTTGVSIQLMALGGKIVDTMPIYQTAPIDQSWARIGDTWQFTNRPTPNAANLSMLEETDEVIDALIPSCAPGYYRFVETNRCRKIPAAPVLAVCKDGQYRSEETGRCRSIAQTVAQELKPCGDDQFRNPATGRCKKIASVEDAPEPCKAGYERNLETNRCRKVKESVMPAADFAVAPITPLTQSMAGWWAFGGLMLIGASYAAWEWRSEMRRALGRLARLFHRL